MASPINNFKNNLFGQLKSCGDVVQDVFQQRIARPLLAFKRDLNQSTSVTYTPDESKSNPLLEQTPSTQRQDSIVPLPLVNTIDTEPTSPLLTTMFNKVKNTLSPSTKRRTSASLPSDHVKKPQTEYRRSSISCLSNKNLRDKRLNVPKSVSFAEDNADTNHQCSSDNEQNHIRNTQTSRRRSLMESIHEVGPNRTDSMDKISPVEENDNHHDDDDEDPDNNDNREFHRHFHEIMRPRRMSIGTSQDLKYQDLSAEIVAYVLKTALRLLEEEEDERLLLEQRQHVPNTNECDEDVIDFK